MDWLFQFAHPSTDWSYVVVALIVRFIGVFGVMFVMLVALQGATKVVQAIERQPGPLPDIPSTPEQRGPVPIPQPDVDGATVAAIGLALSLEAGAAVSTASRSASETSAWAMAGRMQQLSRSPR